DGSTVSGVIVGDVYRCSAVWFRHDGDTGGSCKRRLKRRPIVARVLPFAIARDGRNDVRFRVHLPNTVVVHVRNVDVTGSWIERDIAWHEELRARGRTVVADIAGLRRRAVAGEGVDTLGCCIGRSYLIFMRCAVLIVNDG